jgi:phage terminase large subunit
MQVVLPNNFVPRPYQARAMKYFDEGGRRAFTCWHRRAGKDLCAGHQEVKSAHRDVGQYWHFFPTFEQGRRAIWDGFLKTGERIIENVFPGALYPSRAGSIVKRRNDQSMFLELKCGSVWRIMGTDRVESVGAGPKGVVFSEFALCRPTAWDFVRPMLRESGGWAWFQTTPRGRNHAYKLFKAATPETGWYRDTQTVRDTGLKYASNRGDRELTAEQMMQEEREEGMQEELIRQEYLCDWTAALLGSVFGSLLELLDTSGRTDADFTHPSDGVHTTWDLGISDSTAIWFWRLSGKGVEVIDFYEDHGKALSHYVQVLKDKGFRYETHWLPHDARARTLVTGTSVLEELAEQLTNVRIGPDLSPEDGIQAARWLLQQPETRFHKRCADGVEALRSYHYAYDEDAKVFSKRPQHDWSSHAADAWRYCAVVRKIALSMQADPPEKPKVPDARPLHNSTSLDELWEANRPRGRERV